jgi:predicted ATPase
MRVDLVGRDRELAALEAFFGRERAGAGVLVLEGEAGVGKSSLWLAGVRIAE